MTVKILSPPSLEVESQQLDFPFFGLETGPVAMTQLAAVCDLNSRLGNFVGTSTLFPGLGTKAFCLLLGRLFAFPSSGISFFLYPINVSTVLMKLASSCALSFHEQMEQADCNVKFWKQGT